MIEKHLYHHIQLDPATRQLLLGFKRDVIAAIQDMKETLMATAEEILAKIEANTSILSSIDAAANALEEGQANIKAQIDNLKAQIAAGQVPQDFSAIDQAVDRQGSVIAGIRDSIPDNTEVPPEPSTS
jgi:chromosome segregation ATPase